MPLPEPAELRWYSERSSGVVDVSTVETTGRTNSTDQLHLLVRSGLESMDTNISHRKRLEALMQNDL